MAQLLYCSKCWSSLIRWGEKQKEGVSLLEFWHSDPLSSTGQGEGLRGQSSPWPLPLSVCSRSGIMLPLLLRCSSSCQHLWLTYVSFVVTGSLTLYHLCPGVKSHTWTIHFLLCPWYVMVHCGKLPSPGDVIPSCLSTPTPSPLVCVCSIRAVLLPMCSYVPAVTLRSRSDTFCNCHKTKQVPDSRQGARCTSDL